MQLVAKLVVKVDAFTFPRSTLLIIVMLGCECRGSRKRGGMRKSVTVKLSLSYRSVYLNKEIIFDKLDKLLKKLGAE